MKLRIAATILLVTTFVHRGATADDFSPEQKAKAKAFYQRAIIHYRSGDLQSAAVEFKESYEAFPKPETLYNLAQTHRLLKNYDQAVFYYKQYLSSAQVNDRDRKMVQERIADLEDLLKQQQNAQAAPPQGPEPPATTTEQTQPSPAHPTIATSPPSYFHTRMALGWSGAAVGVGTLAVSAGLLGAAASERSEANAATTQSAFDTHHANSVLLQQVGWPLLGVGAALVVAGTVVLVLNAKGQHR